VKERKRTKDLLPWNISNQHPVTILVFISRGVFRSVVSFPFWIFTWIKINHSSLFICSSFHIWSLFILQTKKNLSVAGSYQMCTWTNFARPWGVLGSFCKPLDLSSSSKVHQPCWLLRTFQFHRPAPPSSVVDCSS